MGSVEMLNRDCFEWMADREENSVTSIVTDPPYGVKEYTDEEIEKKRTSGGGIWRNPPSIGGNVRSAIPRFSVISDDPNERMNVYKFFLKFGEMARRILVPGGHMFIASTPLLSDVLGIALRHANLERRGEVIRTVRTLRGGDRPKGYEDEYSYLSVMPRGLWEPWLIYRKPMSENTVAMNLKKWGAGALRRPSVDVPFEDFIESEKTTKKERSISPHPNLKPQSFMRKIVRASIPLDDGIVLDPFAGGGSTIAAATHLEIDCIGIERDKEFYDMMVNGVYELQKLS